MYLLTEGRGKDREVFEEAKDKGMGVGRDAQRIRYQSMGPSLLQTITLLEDIWGPLEDMRCHSSEEGIQM